MIAKWLSTLTQGAMHPVGSADALPLHFKTITRGRFMFCHPPQSSFFFPPDKKTLKTP
jgi:hypothetical protein